MAKRSVCGQNLTVNFKSTKFEIQSKAMMLKTYIWTKEDLLKYALQILEQGWPFEPMRLLGVRMSSLKRIA